MGEVYTTNNELSVIDTFFGLRAREPFVDKFVNLKFLGFLNIKVDKSRDPAAALLLDLSDNYLK